jgi:hypothetical protein
MGGPATRTVYHISKGTLGLVKPAHKGRWEPYHVTRDWVFDVRYSETSKRLVFAEGDWLLSLDKQLVQVRQVSAANRFR